MPPDLSQRVVDGLRSAASLASWPVSAVFRPHLTRRADTRLRLVTASLPTRRGPSQRSRDDERAQGQPGPARQAVPPLTVSAGHRGLGRARGVKRHPVPRHAPKALGQRAKLRYLRAVEAWPAARDRAIALLPLYAGIRIAEVAVLDLADVRLSARKGEVRRRAV